MGTATQGLKAMSLEENAFVQGGLLQDVDVEILEAMYVPWDYDGKSSNVTEDVLAVKCMVQLLGEDLKPRVGSDGQPEAPREQFWSAGGLFTDVIISEDCHFSYPTPGKQNFTKGSNFHFFLNSLRGCGMPDGYLEDGNLAKLKGIKFHLVRKPAPERPGLTRAEKDKDKSIAACGNILWSPWDNKTTRGKTTRVNGPVAAASSTAAAAAPAATTAPAGATPDSDTEAQAERLVREVLSAAKDGTVSKLSELKILVFRKASTDKGVPADKRNAIGKLAENGPWLENRAIASVSSSGEVTLI